MQLDSSKLLIQDGPHKNLFPSMVSKVDLVMNDIQRYGVTRRWSDAVVHQRTVYFVEVPDDMTADVRGQIGQVLSQIDERLRIVGSDRTRMLQVLIYLPDLADASVLNELWDAWVPEGHAPARACVQATLGNPRCRVEMVITAAVPNVA